MKKIYILSFILFVLLTGTARASVTSDTRVIQYQTCITALAKLESANYVKPDPNDPAFHSTDFPEFTYAKALTVYNNLVKTRQDKEAECAALNGSSLAPISSGVLNTSMSAPSTTTSQTDTISTPSQNSDLLTQEQTSQGDKINELDNKFKDLQIDNEMNIAIEAFMILTLIYLVGRRNKK